MFAHLRHQIWRQNHLQGFGEPQIRSQKDLVLIPEPAFYRGAHWGLTMHTGF